MRKANSGRDLTRQKTRSGLCKIKNVGGAKHYSKRVLRLRIQRSMPCALHLQTAYMHNTCFVLGGRSCRIRCGPTLSLLEQREWKNNKMF